MNFIVCILFDTIESNYNIIEYEIYIEKSIIEATKILFFSSALFRWKL